MERQMDFDRVSRESLIHHLRDALPLSARPRPALLAFLRARGAIGRSAPRLVVVDIFDAGGAQGLMCRFEIAGETDASSFVAQLTQLALDRRHPLAQRLAERRRRAQRTGAA
ncbi:hypothetical protein D1O30_00140 [Methylocystis hirsuta]|uniref:Uncharacterized protein n=2 Tax=Methylocystis hirsuta TaxID=369798 RepID=A0A3M9XKG1_9HYPH|nr:hypothetical protein D1O30_00140 [Methylocystis hirsuta]